MKSLRRVRRVVRKLRDNGELIKASLKVAEIISSINNNPHTKTIRIAATFFEALEIIKNAFKKAKKPEGRADS